MTTQLKDMTMEECLKAIASKEPAPGGGSAAALTAALAAALVSFVCRVTIGKNKYAHAERAMSEALCQAEDLRRQLLLLIEEDKNAFLSVLECRYSRVSIVRAVAVSRTIADRARKVRSLAAIVAKKGNRNARTDALAAATLARSAIAIAESNIRANEHSLPIR